MFELFIQIRTRLFSMVAVFLVSSFLISTHVNAAISDEQVQQAIAQIQEFLFKQQNDKGTWEGRHSGEYPGGETAIVTYALLTSGISPQDPRLERALDYLLNVDMDRTYSLSLRAHCLAAMPGAYAGKLTHDANALIGIQNAGRFGYHKGRNGFDHSNTQYGILGLWEYSKRGGTPAPNMWQNVINHFESTQNRDGGWPYNATGSSTESMTAAGLTSLLVAQERLHKNNDVVDEELRDAILRGITWLDVKARNKSGLVGGSKMYDLYSVERVAMACGIKMFGGRDWFEAGAEHILKRTSSIGAVNNGGSLNGGTVVNTSFALLFLSRGRVPVWMNKIQIDTMEWNNRPNDINLLTRRLSSRREQEQNWQVVNIASDPYYWLNAPIAWISAREEVKLTEDEFKNLQVYLQVGGMLVVNPESNNRDFLISMRDELHKMFPRAKWYDMDSTHPMRSLLHLVKMPKKHKIKVLTNGVRDIAILLPHDWGLMLQRGQTSTSYKPDLLMLNLYAMVTDRGRLENRFSTPLVPRKRGDSTREVMVIRASYKGNWGQEPMWLHAIGSIMHNRADINVVRANKKLNQIEEIPNALVHLSGSNAVTFASDELASIKKFIEAGGTMLVETIGGRGDFSIQAQDQLSLYLQLPIMRLPESSPIINGTINNGFNMTHSVYRHFSMANMNLRDKPRLAAIYYQDRPAIIFSHEDMTLGALGVRHWGINGYEIDDARKLWCNLLLTIERSVRFSANDDNTKKQRNVMPVIPEGIANLIVSDESIN
ncbi:DUF4159 domain-containing protein [Planctomycetota bacterium]|nr:DUF4159 domain-containing protein [Planctomycetota bacterium]